MAMPRTQVHRERLYQRVDDTQRTIRVTRVRRTPGGTGVHYEVLSAGTRFPGCTEPSALPMEAFVRAYQPLPEAAGTDTPAS